MLDTSALNRLVDDADALNALVDKAGVLRVMITHIQVDEVNRTSDAERKERLTALCALCTEVRTEGAVYDVSRYDEATYSSEGGQEIERIKIGNPKHAADALIINTAEGLGCTLVMIDVPAVRRAARVAPNLNIISYETFRTSLLP